MQKYYDQPYVVVVALVVNAPQAQAPQKQNVGQNQTRNARNKTHFTRFPCHILNYILT